MHANDQIKLVINFLPFDEVKEAYLSRDLVIDPIELPAESGEVSIEIDPDPIFDRVTTVAVRWDDDTFSSIPISPSLAFTDKPIRIDFYGANALEGKLCAELAPDTAPQAFLNYFVCQKMALSLLRERKWRRDHRGALKGWMEANYMLVDAAKPSPYRFDGNLIGFLSEIMDSIVSGNQQSDAFEPILLSDLQRIFQLELSQDVYLARTVADLVKKDNYEDALYVNRYLVSVFDNFSIRPGVNFDTLRANDSYIKELIKAANRKAANSTQSSPP
jgi:hypothetical protein